MSEGQILARSRSEPEYPVRLEADYPAASSRLLALCGALFFFPKVVLAVPHLFVLYFLGLAAGFVIFLGYWIVLFTGQYPRGLYDFALGVLRWQIRVNA
ncbi:MAG: DUF4389 domain-containing protein [Gemmataceae bacterium]|nr:DUF4389 domain-containing protein [Gemmataceae bacterium]